MRHVPAFSVHQEADHVASSAIVRVVVASVVIGVAGVMVAAALLVASAGSVRRPAEGNATSTPARWPVEQTPILDTQRGIDLGDRQRRALERWGWVDRDAGVATVPIDEAIDMVIGAPP